MLRHKRQFLTITLLVFLLIAPTYISFVSSSTGYIRVNSTSASAPNQQVQAGGNVNLYFGDVTWSGSELYLLMSHDMNPQLSPGDNIYTPLFSVYDVADTSATRSYTSNNLTWVVGYHWINGSIPNNLPVGNYTIKSLDGVAANAVTDTYIRVTSGVYNATLAITPASGTTGVTAGPWSTARVTWKRTRSCPSRR